jgi:hypothetical protein
MHAPEAPQCDLGLWRSMITSYISAESQQSLLSASVALGATAAYAITEKHMKLQLNHFD